MFPKQKLIYGPQQIESRIDQEPPISQQLTLWGQGGSSVIRGTLLVIPISNACSISSRFIWPPRIRRRAAAVKARDRLILGPGGHVADA